MSNLLISNLFSINSNFKDYSLPNHHAKIIPKTYAVSLSLYPQPRLNNTGFKLRVYIFSITYLKLIFLSNKINYEQFRKI